MAIEKVKKNFPSRDEIITELFNLIGNPNECFPDNVFLFGDTSTGKTSLVKKFLRYSGSKFIYIDLIECYVTKLLFENILNGLKFSSANILNSHEKCDTMQDLVNEMKQFEMEFSYIICIDNADRLRNMDSNVLPALLRLQEFTGLNICCLLISQIPIEKFYLKTGLSDIITINFPQYNRQEMQQILLNDFENVKNFVVYKFNTNPEITLNKISIKEFFNHMNIQFYENYLNAFLGVFYRSCRDLTELKIWSRNIFEIYCLPVLNGEIDQDDVSKLWRSITNHLKTSLSSIYTRIEGHSNHCEKENFENNEVKNIVKSLELPFYAKYLLIAGFLASHNPAKDDKKLFVKNSSKQKKRMQTVNANAKVSERMSTSLGPKSFSIDRLLAIFYAIIDDKVGLTCNLLTQISTLVQLKFLAYVSGENNLMDGTARLQCVVNLDFIQKIGKIVGFNVKKYLSDFM